MNNAILFSPHPDDAVLSASHRLIAGGIRVVTIFTGTPPDETEPGFYDRLTGATSPHARALERQAEDDAAMKLLNCETSRLGELDQQYRKTPVDDSALARLIEPFTRNATEVWAPAGIGGHPDHLATRKAVTAAVPAEAALYFYAELPYSLRYGWPSWVTGQAEPQYLDLSFWLAHELDTHGLARQKLTPIVFPLDGDQKRHKEQAALCYRTQLPALKLSPVDAPRWQEFMAYELAWKRERAMCVPRSE
jgi:LmbE family N-acetylglucosaminyl deacetylase